MGKSSILNQFTEGTFSETMPPTLGLDYKISQISSGEDTIKLQIWDTAGQEKFKSITENFYKGAQGIILVFDLTDRASFDNIRVWLKNIFEKAGKQVVICLVGNKLDLYKQFAADSATAGRCVPPEDVEQLLNEHAFHYLQTSAKTNVNVKEAFDYVGVELLKKNGDLIREHKSKALRSKPTEEPDKKGCC